MTRLKMFSINYGGLTTTIVEDESVANYWHIRTFNTGTRMPSIGHAEVIDSATALGILFSHLRDPDCKLEVTEL